MQKGKTITENNLTKGNVFRILFTFSLPFIAANLIQALYGPGKRSSGINRHPGHTDHHQHDYRPHPGKHHPGGKIHRHAGRRGH